MGLDAILEAIAAEANHEITEIRQGAQAQVDNIIADAETRAGAERRRWSEARVDEAELETSRLVNGARLEVDRLLAAVREELFQLALEKVRSRLAAIASSLGYEEILAALYAEATAVITDGDAVIRVRPEDAEVMVSIAEGRQCVEGSLDCLGGVDLMSDDGRGVRNTLDARLARAERQLRRLARETIPEMTSAGDS